MSRGKALLIGAVGVFALIVLTAIVHSRLVLRPALAAGGSEPLAEVDGQAITAQEVERALAPQLRRLEEQIYSLKRQKLDDLISERLLAAEAARRGVSTSALVDTEITSRVPPVTDQEVHAFYEANQDRIRGEEPALRERIRAYLHAQRVKERRDAFVKTLRARAHVVVHLAPPPDVRAAVSTEGAPILGPAAAPVTIVEFSDFHCPYCKAVEPTVKAVLARYGDKVRLAYRDFPLDQLHPGARKAAEAARCAGDQGKFWPYHDLVYGNPPDSSPEQLKKLAQQAGLDVAAFDACVASGKHRDEVQKDVDEGVRLGVDATPTFFINGRMLSGAQPLEAFVALIDEELARTH